MQGSVLEQQRSEEREKEREKQSSKHNESHYLHLLERADPFSNQKKTELNGKSYFGNKTQNSNFYSPFKQSKAKRGFPSFSQHPKRADYQQDFGTELEDFEQDF